MKDNNNAFQNNMISPEINSTNNNQNSDNNDSKKKIIIIVVIGLVIIAAVAILMISNTDKKESPEENKTTTSEKNSASSNNEESKNDEEKEEQKKSGDYYFWKDTLKSGTKKEITYLFNDKFSLPLTKENIKKYGKFRLEGLNYINGIKYENHEHTDFETILNQTNYDNRMEKSYPWSRIKLYDNEFKDEISIVIENPKYEVASVNGIFDNGYWYVTTSSIYTLYNSSFGIKNNDLKIWNEDTKKYELFDEIINIFGYPSYVIADDNFDTKTPYDSTSCSYHLVYEYDEYVVTISIHEMVFSDSKSIKSQVNQLAYYPRNGWDNYYKEDVTKSWNASIKYLR